MTFEPIGIATPARGPDAPEGSIDDRMSFTATPPGVTESTREPEPAPVQMDAGGAPDAGFARDAGPQPDVGPPF